MTNQPIERYEDTDLYRIRHSAAHVLAQLRFTKAL